MSKTSQWIANSLFILSCIFLPWRHNVGHAAGAAGFIGYYFPFTQPDGASLDSLVFILQIVLIGAILLWTETFLNSDPDISKRRYLGITLGIALAMILFPPFVLLEPSYSYGTPWGTTNYFEGFGFLFSNAGEGILAARILVPELIALFGLSTLAMKYHSKRIAARPIVIAEEQPIIEAPDTTDRDFLTQRNVRLA